MNLKSIVALLLFSTLNFSVLFAEEPEKLDIAIEEPYQQLHTIQFSDIPVIEFIQYVSKLSNLSFLFDQKDLNFTISLSGRKPVSTEGLLKALISLLEAKGFHLSKDHDCFVIQKLKAGEKKEALLQEKKIEIPPLLAMPIPALEIPSDPLEFNIYKVKYHQGSEIEAAVKKIAMEESQNKEFSQKLLKGIQSIQWLKTTNSLLFSADPTISGQIRRLVESLDVPLRQVFIEVLVVETDAKKSADFGLEWGASGMIDNRVRFATGNTKGSNSSFSQGMGAPLGLSQIPLVGGFDMGVIGDIIMHKGKSYLTLGSLVSALESDTHSTIVLNQKIITQDNKNSTIFVGDNIPFTGSVVQTVGQSQQTTANVEYRDVGVKLSITPMLGENNIITLDINQEITESLDDFLPNSASSVNGIRTTKTNMVTHVHVPDQNFLVLSGMIRNSQLRHQTGIPCLGGLPLIGAAFSHKRDKDEKRNIIIFVRPRIINSFDEYQKITEGQQALSEQATPSPLSKMMENVQEKIDPSN